jgi:hypothetical protein
MKLADRPAYHLAELMAARAISGQLRLGKAVWPDLADSAARGRIRNILAGHIPACEILDQLAAWFDVDAGVFYSAPGES